MYHNMLEHSNILLIFNFKLLLKQQSLFFLYNFYMWKFIKSATNNDNFLMGHAKEVAFIGRSNVGKSSLINALTNQKSLARTSNTPGRTQLINFFQDGNKTFVDLPGYGYAKMPLPVKEQMLLMIQNYFYTRKELIKVFVLIDAKIGPTKDDKEIIDFLKKINRDIFIVMTKIDKTNQSQLHKATKKIEDTDLEYLQISSKTGKKISNLRNYINSLF